MAGAGATRAGDATAPSNRKADAPLRFRTGGGNIVTQQPGTTEGTLYAALRGTGAKVARVTSYNWRTIDRRPIPERFDAAILKAYREGIVPIILLEYSGTYAKLVPPQPVGSYADWFAAGEAFAKRFRPGGQWGRENGIADWGVTVFAAINEPDVEGLIPTDAYRDALAGFADGVHAVDRTLRVVPGGFGTCNAQMDPTLRGYGPAIRDLLEDRRLNGIDLHTYYDPRWYPITRGRDFSAQGCFDRVKAALHLKRDVEFYATEFNVAQVDAWKDPKTAARLFLTAFWDHLGVVHADGRSPATVLALSWYLADTGRIQGPAYAMAATEDPWTPAPRAVVLRTVLDLAGDMTFSALDPRGAGTYVMDGERGRLHVWQNLPGWTDRPGSSWELTAPNWARRAELWGWDGLRRTLAVDDGKLTITGLPGNETYMVLFPRP